MDFQTFHKYNRLVRRELVQPLACDYCLEPLGLRKDDSDEPILVCYYCNSTVHPGLDLYAKVKAVVDEHFSATRADPYGGPV